MTAFLKHTRTLLLAAVVGAAGLAAGAGCASDVSRDSGDRDDDNVRSASGEVPRTARLVERDFGGLTYRAPDDGTIWVVESEKDRVIFTGRVRRGDEFRLEPDRDRAYLNDKRVLDTNINADIRHRIYFESEDRRDDRVGGDTEWDLASDRARDRARDRDLERDRDLDRDVGDDRISRDPGRY